MPLHPDDTICFCFHVPLRKIESFCRREKPRAPGLISDCLAAGTGCGWCIPMLTRIHTRICGQYKPWWKDEPGATPATKPPSQEGGTGYHSAEREATVDAIDAAAYAAGRSRYLAETHRQAPRVDPADPS
jgi:bacterioferritin-associated ferredoxin